MLTTGRTLSVNIKIKRDAEKKSLRVVPFSSLLMSSLFYRERKSCSFIDKPYQYCSGFKSPLKHPPYPLDWVLRGLLLFPPNQIHAQSTLWNQLKISKTIYSEQFQKCFSNTFGVGLQSSRMTAIKGKLICRLSASKLSGDLTTLQLPWTTSRGAPQLCSKLPAKCFTPLHFLISPRPMCLLQEGFPEIMVWEYNRMFDRWAPLL